MTDVLSPSQVRTFSDCEVRCQILAQSGEWVLAREHLDRAIQIQGDTPAAARAYYLRAGIHGEQNELEGARADLERAVQLRPDFAEAWSDLGTVRRNVLDETGALSAFERAVRIDPKNGKSQFRLGSEYLHSGKPHEAVEHLREALRLDPEDRATLYNLQMALRADGQGEEAKRVEDRMGELLRQRNRASQTAIQAVKLNNAGVEAEKAGSLREALEKYRDRRFIIADVLPGPLVGKLPEFLLASGGKQKGRHRRALPVERRRMPAARRRIPQLDFRLSLGQHARQRARVGRRAGKSDNRRQYKRHGHLRGAA
jgi:tetratricopeptide (TPR) repeat protein